MEKKGLASVTAWDAILSVHYNYDSLICVPGCDKNLPGVTMAMFRLNRPKTTVSILSFKS